MPPTQAIQHGTSIGGARPKATLNDDGRQWIAKFSSTSDLYPVVKAEFVAMRLATLAGIRVAPVRLLRAAGKDVLLVERFDRLCGNTDDHARNHAVFWDGEWLSLTPAYDICPQLRTGQEATQAMKIFGENRLSRLSVCVHAAARFQLSATQSREIIDRMLATVRTHWQSVCDEASLGEAQRQALWERQFLNPYRAARLRRARSILRLAEGEAEPRPVLASRSDLEMP